MKLFSLAGILAMAMCLYPAAAASVKQLQIGVKYKPADCPEQTQNGDRISVHYTGSLEDGEVFDSSVTRGQPFNFDLGKREVILGWEQGLQNMCIGEKRKLKIPAHLGYGDRGSPPKIPGGATLIFEVELIDIPRRRAAQSDFSSFGDEL